MRIQKLSSTDGFLAIDLVDAPSAAGVVRLAPKILQGGAKDLARSLTYTFASFGIQRAGLSGGLNATPETRADAIAAMVTELTEAVAGGRMAIDAGKGLEPAEITGLAAVDTRHPQHGEIAGDALAAGVVAAASAAVGGLDGRTVSIEGFGATGPALAAGFVGAGATLVAIGTASGAVLAPDGLDPAALAAGWSEHGDGLGAALAGDAEAEPAWKALTAGADVLVVGSKTGVLSHSNVGRIAAKAVVPHGPLPYTTKAMLMLERSGAVVVPDFLSTAGPALTWWPEGDPSVTAVAERIATAVTSAVGHERGCFLGACFAAEAFLSTWQEHLPFGRPLAP